MDFFLRELLKEACELLNLPVLTLPRKKKKTWKMLKNTIALIHYIRIRKYIIPFYFVLLIFEILLLLYHFNHSLPFFHSSPSPRGLSCSNFQFMVSSSLICIVCICKYAYAYTLWIQISIFLKCSFIISHSIAIRNAFRADVWLWIASWCTVSWERLRFLFSTLLSCL